MGTLNYTTRVPVEKSLGEIQAMLVRHGADAVATMFDQGNPVGMTFRIATPDGPRSFRLPVQVDAVHQLLVTQVQSGAIAPKAISRAVATSPEQAARVAWRVAKDWLEANLAVIEAQMLTLEQVMFPHLLVDNEHTMWERYLEHGRRAVES